MQDIKLAAAYLQEAARTLQGSEHAKAQFVQDTLKLINQAYTVIQQFEFIPPTKRGSKPQVETLDYKP